MANLKNLEYKEVNNTLFTPAIKRHVTAFAVDMDNVINVMSYIGHLYDKDAEIFEIRKKDSEADFPLYEAYSSFDTMANAIVASMESGDRGRIGMGKNAHLYVTITADDKNVVFNFIAADKEPALKFFERIKDFDDC